MQGQAKARGLRRRSRAFTMAEIVITILILMIGIIPVYESLVKGSKSTRFNRRRTFAASIANNLTEILKKMHITELVAKAGDIGTIYGKADQCKDPLVAPWEDPKIQKLMDANPKFKATMEGYQKELKYYEILPTVIEDPTYPERMCTVQIRVTYVLPEMGANKYKTVASAMVLTDPTFPAGKALTN